MLLFPVISVIINFFITYVPFFLRVFWITKKSSSHSFWGVNARDAGRELPLKESMDEGSYNFVQRLWACHLNHLELQGIYSAGIAAALATPTETAATNALAGIFLASRVLYTIVYAMKPILSGALRSTCFEVSVLSIIGIWIAVAVAVS